MEQFFVEKAVFDKKGLVLARLRPRKALTRVASVSGSPRLDLARVPVQTCGRFSLRRPRTVSFIVPAGLLIEIFSMHRLRVTSFSWARPRQRVQTLGHQQMWRYLKWQSEKYRDLLIPLRNRKILIKV